MEERKKVDFWRACRVRSVLTAASLLSRVNCCQLDCRGRGAWVHADTNEQATPTRRSVFARRALVRVCTVGGCLCRARPTERDSPSDRERGRTPEETSARASTHFSWRNRDTFAKADCYLPLRTRWRAGRPAHARLFTKILARYCCGLPPCWTRARLSALFLVCQEWHKESGQRTRPMRSRSAHTLTPSAPAAETTTRSATEAHEVRARAR